MPIWENLFFKGFYPPWMPFFIPQVPLDAWLFVMVLGHYVVAGAVTYTLLTREFTPRVSLPLTFLFLLPMTVFNAHISKLIAWPWMVVGAWYLRPEPLTERAGRSGAIVGLCGGMILLTGNAYFAFYLAIFSGILMLAMRSFPAIRTAGFVSLAIGSPKLLSAIAPILRGARDSNIADPLTLNQFVVGLIGFSYQGSITVWPELIKGAYAVVGLPVCLLVIGGLIWSYADPGRFRTQWLAGILGAFAVAALLVSASPLVYSLPGVDMFRVVYRAMTIFNLGLLLIVVELVTVLKWTPEIPTRPAVIAISVLLLVSSANAAVPAVAQVDKGWESATEPTVGREVVDTATRHGCTPVWLETNARWDPNDKSSRYHKQISYALAEQGVPTGGISYAKAGQDYSTHTPDGDLTFEALILQGGARLPTNGTVTLTGGWGTPDRGHINVSRFAVVDTVDAPRGVVRIYAINGTC
jgi:hypothetical protein